jgi:WD40 repeat protein
LHGHSATIRALEFSPDGKQLASAGNDAVRIWDIESGQETATFDLSAKLLAFSPEGDRLAVVANDESVKLLNGGDSLIGVPYSTPQTTSLHRDDSLPVVGIPNKQEGETLFIASKSGGLVEVQNVEAFNFSGGAQLWWRDAQIGDILDVEFDVPETGRYRILANLTCAPDYGIAKLAINGRKFDQAIDGYHKAVTSRDVDLGTFELNAGMNHLTVEIVGDNEKAIQRHMFGLDYLTLELVGP